MTFLNWAMLVGLAAVSIPIIIHLLNRQRARIVDWGAMRFLLASLASRRRRILIEEIILMALRCLILMLLVLALARPFLPTQPAIPWAVVLPLLIIAAICFGVGAAMGWRQPSGKVLMVGASALVALALVAAVVEQFLQRRAWSLSGGERDVALIVDGSRSMTLNVDGKPNFDRAIETAHAVVDSLRPADAVSLILAGPVPQPVIATPTASREDVKAALERLEPTAGPVGVLESLNAAVAGLAEGSNPAKMIVLVTDGQALGWDLQAEDRWQFLVSGLEKLPTSPRLLVRTLDLPERYENAAVGDIRLSRGVVGTDRPVNVDVTVLATGTESVEPSAVELFVGGQPVARLAVGRVEAGAAETVRFSHRFEAPGPHVVRAEVVIDDDLPADNADVRVVDVVGELPVLIVDGSPSVRPLESASAFVEIAMTPGDAGARHEESDRRFLVSPTVVAAPDVGSVLDLGAYAVLVLADVPTLPESFAAKVEAFVAEGGGLLVLPGHRAEPDFYNGWRRRGGGPFVPARFEKRLALPDQPARVAVRTFAHPALALMAAEEGSDADSAMVAAFWQLDPPQRNPDVRVAGRLDSGDPLLVERRVGDGYVLVSAFSLDRRDSNLPSLKCFVPLVHELAYYLASPMLARSNIEPGSEMVVELFPSDGRPPASSPGADSPGGNPRRADLRLPETVPVTTPDGAERSGRIAATDAGVRLTFEDTWQPGLYRFRPEASLTSGYEVTEASDGGMPFAVLGEPEEGRLAALTDGDYAAAGRYVDFFRAETTDDLTAAVVGSVPGQELWKVLALALLFALLAEVALTRWIAVRRRTGEAGPVDFGEEIVDAATLRRRTRSILRASTE